MKKIVLILFLFITSLVFAQTTTVTATVTYPDSETFANGTVLATFTPPTGIIDQNLYLLNGASFPYFVSGTFNGVGQFTMTLTDDHLVRPVGGRWMFTVCSPATIQCTNSLQDVFGASIDLSALISSDVSPIFSSANGEPIYFADSEVKTNTYGGLHYFNYISKVMRCWDGSVWANCGGGGGGGGGVSSFSAGDFNPIFTTNVLNPGSTPILSFIAENAPAHTVFGNETGSSAVPSFQTDAFTLNVTTPLTGGGLTHLGGSVTVNCPTCSTPQVSATGTSPIVVTPSPGVSTFVISCPTCGTSTGTVSNLTVGNLSPLFTSSVANPTTTPAVTFSLSTAPAHTVYANETGGTALPSFQTDLVTINTTSPLGGGGSLELGGSLTLTCSACAGGGGGADKISFDQVSPAETSSTGATWTTTNFGGAVWDAGLWQFPNGQNSDIYASVRIPSNIVGTPHVILDIFGTDTTVGHTTTFQICDAVSTSQNLNVGSLTCGATQNYVSSVVQFSTTELSFAISSTAVIDQYLIVKIHQSSGGTTVGALSMEPPKLKVF